MEVERSERLELKLSPVAHGSVFVHSYSDRVDLDFNDVNAESGVSHVIEVKIPMALARKLSEELANDLAEYDAKVAEKAAEKELAESSEN
tara:strand:+ start:213 stop:482 length:270 start_codon:yes stop_codon:yes gene_type:complete